MNPTVKYKSEPGDDGFAMPQAPLLSVPVVRVRGEYAEVAAGNFAELPLAPALLRKVGLGTFIFVFQQNGMMGAVGVDEDPKRLGPEWEVVKVDGRRAVVSQNIRGPVRESRHVVHRFEDLAVGELVLLDQSNNAVTHHVGVANEGTVQSSRYEVGDSSVSWDDVGGCREAKRALFEAAIEPRRHRELYEAYGKRPTKGILLCGPPGNGKTMLGKALARAVAEEYGRAQGGFLYVKGPELLQSLVGQSEGNIRAIFDAAAAFKKKNGFPTVVFLDEGDALLGRRGGGRLGQEGMERTTVPQFLTCMDGMEESGALVIVATNRPDALDPAVVREGRCDRKVRVGQPSESDAREIASMALRGKKIDHGAFDARATTPETHVVECLMKVEQAVYMARCRNTSLDRRVPMRAFVSGALVVDVVEKATQHALRRDIEAKARVPSGIGLGDFAEAIAEKRLELHATNQWDAVFDFMGKDAGELARIEPVT